MDLGDFLTSINKTKDNLIREGDPETARSYPAFIVRRILSYSKDAVLYANEINCLPGLDPRLQYEFFLYSLTKRNRFARLERAEVHQDVELLCSYYQCSREKAQNLLHLHTDEQIAEIRTKYAKGGPSK